MSLSQRGAGVLIPDAQLADPEAGFAEQQIERALALIHVQAEIAQVDLSAAGGSLPFQL